MYRDGGRYCGRYMVVGIVVGIWWYGNGIVVGGEMMVSSSAVGGAKGMIRGYCGYGVVVYESGC
jgi:hypothetical protein